MPRGIRIITQNSYYHVVNRGNHKEKIFLNESDYGKYLQILKRYKRKYCIKLLGYCLMPNHVHMVLGLERTSELPKFMQCLTQSYAQYFNHKYKSVGHLWQGRFKSMNIETNTYFLDCIYYVEANPVRSGLTTSPADYLWSSYKMRMQGNIGEFLDFPDST